MGKNKLDAVTFCKLFDMFGDEGRVRASTIEKYLYTDETKEECSQRLKAEYKDFE